VNKYRPSLAATSVFRVTNLTNGPYLIHAVQIRRMASTSWWCGNQGRQRFVGVSSKAGWLMIRPGDQPLLAARRKFIGLSRAGARGCHALERS